MKNNRSEALFERDWEKTADEICRFIADQVSSQRAGGLVIGISGGLDSAVVAFLGVRALGADKIKALFLPERDTAAESYSCAREITAAASLKLEEIDLTPTLETLGCYEGAVAGITGNKVLNRLAFWSLHHLFKIDPYRITLKKTDIAPLNRAIALLRLKHRLRMAVLYKHAEQENLLVAGCLNLTEQLTGLFVPFGDSAADIAPILPLYKTEVRDLARYLGVPQKVIEREPSPDLLPGIVDETALGITYTKLDLLLHALQEKESDETAAGRAGTDEDTVKRIRKLTALAGRLTQPVPAPELSR